MGSFGHPYDFIVVGAGPAGCMAAATIANSKQKPTVALIEAGGNNDNRAARISAERWISKMIPEQNWSYKTVPQKAMNDRVVDYDRGKGLGGSSCINFCVWTVAPADDHDEIARLTGDEEWLWSNAQQRYKRIESYFGNSPHISEQMGKYLSPDQEIHGTSGPVKVGFPKSWEKAYIKEMDAFLRAGYASNSDINNGKNLGVGVVPSTAFQGVRSTAADAVVPTPENLTIVTDSHVARVMFKDSTAVGVELIDGTIISASKEVILSAGAIDTPKILMHSGVGPADELQKYNITIVDDNQAVGRNLHDHPFVFLSFPRYEDVSGRLAYFRDPETQAKARRQWEEDTTGPLTEIFCQVGTNFHQDAALFQTEEFANLSDEWKTFMQKPGVPTNEQMLNVPNFDILMDPHNAPVGAWFGCFLMNPMSRGRISLQSSNPADPASIDLNMLSHPYDRRNAITSTRAIIKVANSEPDSATDLSAYLIPKSDSEEDILAFWKQSCIPTWHATGSVKMGKDVNDSDTCVDKDFRVRNINHLRVADLSVVPFVTNNHTQTTAYLVGVMVGDRLVEEYGLDK